MVAAAQSLSASQLPLRWFFELLTFVPDLVHNSVRKISVTVLLAVLAFAAPAIAADADHAFGFSDSSVLIDIVGGGATVLVGSALWADGQNRLDAGASRSPFITLRAEGVGLVAFGGTAATDAILHALIPAHRSLNWWKDWPSHIFLIGGVLEVALGASLWGVAASRASNETAVGNSKPSDSLLLGGVGITSVGIGCLLVAGGRIAEIVSRKHRLRLGSTGQIGFSIAGDF